MRVYRNLASLTVAATIILATASFGLCQEYTYEKTTNVTWGGIWCLPVFDGTNIVISSEATGTIQVAKYDLGLNLLSSPVAVASTNDTDSGDNIADHKHVFQDDHHFIVFSTSGAASDGGYLYLVKFDRNFARVGISNVISNDPPTNDMLMFGDGNKHLYIGNFEPGIGHDMYVYDTDLNYVTNYPVGLAGPGYSDNHANGSVGIFFSNKCHLVVQEFMGPSYNESYHHLAFETNGMVTTHKEVVLTDTGTISLVTGLLYDPNNNAFVAHYMHSTNDDGDIGMLILDTNWNYVANHIVITGLYARPHNLIVSNRMYVTYDGSGGVFASSFFIGKVRPIKSLVTYDFQTSAHVLEQSAESWTNLITPSSVDTHTGSPLDMSGIDDRGIGDLGWDTTNREAYFEFSAVATTDYEMAAMEIHFADLAEAGGPTNWQVCGSQDNYSNILAEGLTHAAWTTNSVIIGLADLTGTNTFRIFGMNAASGSARWTIDNLEIKGYMERSDLADDDGDGIPNGWEFRHTGSTTAMDPTRDNDNDGYTNYFEYLADTIPMHSEVYFELSNIVQAASNVFVLGLKDTSSRRIYSAQQADHLTGTVSWTSDSNFTAGLNGPLFLVETNASDLGFYRINISIPGLP